MGEENIKKSLERLNELNEIQELDYALKNNMVDFDYNNKTYRVRKPTTEENLEVRKNRTKFYLSLLKEEGYMLEEELIQHYQKKGISITEITQKTIQLQAEQERLLLLLAQQETEKEVELLKGEILNIREEQTKLFLRKNELLEHSIEKQTSDYANSYLTYLVLEIKEDNKWKRVYSSFNQFMQTLDESLIMRATYFLSMLVYRHDLQ